MLNCLKGFEALVKASHLDHEQPLLLLAVTLEETVLGSLQAAAAVVQAGQSLQRPVTPHDVQLQDGVVIHRAEQSRAALTAHTETSTHH